MKRRGRDHVLATVLFTDIVGSSRVAAEMGDRRWRALLDRHHAIVRGELKRFGGRELDTAGDGFFAVFDEPSDGIRCACAASDGVRQLGIEIRAGVNLGEAEFIGGKLGGMAVHAAARIMALAGPGEVLVASTVRDLVPGSGFTFVDTGTHALRDVPGEWRLFSVTGVDDRPREGPLEPEAAADQRASIQQPPLLRRRRARPVIIAAALAAVLVVVAIALTGGGAPDKVTAPLKITRNSAARIDPKTRTLSAVLPLTGIPVAVAFGEGSVWVVEQNGTIARIDPTTEAVQTVGVGGNPAGIAVGEGVIWILDAIAGSLIPIDAKTNAVGSPLEIPLAMTGIAYGFGAVWLTGDARTLSTHGVVYRVDPSTGTIAGRAGFAIGTQEQLDVAVGEGSVWATDNGGGLFKVDPSPKGRPFAPHSPDPLVRTSTLQYVRLDYNPNGSFDFGPEPVVAGSGSVWIVSPVGTLYRIDPATGEVADRIGVGSGAVGLAVDGGRVWVAFTDGTVSSIEPGTASVAATIRVGGLLDGIAIGPDDAPWIVAEGAVSAP